MVHCTNGAWVYIRRDGSIATGWTPQPPTESGWFWYKKTGAEDDEAEPFLVWTMGDIAHTRMVRGGFWGEPKTLPQMTGGLWQGPIVPRK